MIIIIITISCLVVIFLMLMILLLTAHKAYALIRATKALMLQLCKQADKPNCEVYMHILPHTSCCGC